jgi:serine/threonine protein kinase
MRRRGAIELSGMEGGIVAGRWRLERRVASAAGLAVFAGSEVRSGRAATIELALAGRLPDSEAARVRNGIDQISHPGLLAELEVGATPDGLRYVAMDRTDGDALSALLARRGALDPEESVEIASAIAQVLAAIHAGNAAHANLHPARVFVRSHAGKTIVQLALGLLSRRSLSLKLEGADSDVALILARNSAVAWDDVVRSVVTPLAYCAPEQLLGQAPTARSDVYALGALLYEMLGGEPPHACQSAAATAAARVALPPLPLPLLVPARLRSEVDRALAGDPAARHSSARGFADALGQAAKRLRSTRTFDRPTLRNWKLVRRVRASGSLAHWETESGLLLVRLPLALAADSTKSSAFMREAAAFSAVAHSAIARLLDWAIEQGVAYVVLEAPPGKTLTELARGAPVPAQIAARIGLDAIDAIESAHAAGAVFGDLGPDNIIITKDGMICLLPSCSRAGDAAARDDIAALVGLVRQATRRLPEPDTAAAFKEWLLRGGPIAKRGDVVRFVREASEPAKSPAVAPHELPPAEELGPSAAPAPPPAEELGPSAAPAPPPAEELGPSAAPAPPPAEEPGPSTAQSDGRDCVTPATLPMDVGEASESRDPEPASASEPPVVTQAPARARAFPSTKLTLTALLLVALAALAYFAWTRFVSEGGSAMAPARAPTASGVTSVASAAPPADAPTADAPPAPAPPIAPAPTEPGKEAAERPSVPQPPPAAASTERYQFVPQGL